MRPPNTRNWTGEDPAKPITADATPPASLPLLVQADLYPLDVATMPYAATARAFDGLTDSGHKTRYLGVIVAPAAVHGRGTITRSWHLGTTIGENNESWTTTGGTAGNDVVVTFTPVSAISADQAAMGFGISYVYGFGSTPLPMLAPTGETINDAPTSPVDRQYELTAQASPYVEPCKVTRAAGFSLWVTQRVADLETL